MKFLDLLFSRHRRFKGQSYFKHHLPFMLVFFSIFALFSAESFGGFVFVLIYFTIFDMLLAFGAWLYYDTDL